MKKTVVLPSLLASCALCVPAVRAEEPPWSLRLGVAHLAFDTDAAISVGGAPLPGANAEVKNNTTLVLEVGFRLSPAWTARLLLGVPPTTTLTGSGTITGTGTLGRAKYGPLALTATYGFDALGPVRPYLGAGVVYNIVFESQDGFISNLDVKNSFGSVLQAGLELPLDGGWSVALDVKKIFLKAKATGTVAAFGGAPASATLTLNPLVTSLTIGKTF